MIAARILNQKKMRKKIKPIDFYFDTNQINFFKFLIKMYKCLLN